MLGLADRSKLISLFREILLGDQKKSIMYLRELIDNGLDSKNFLNDILEILYLFGRRMNLGPIDNETLISESEITLIDEYTKSLDMQDLGLFWQLTIKTMEDLKIVSNESLTLEMYVMQLIHLKNIENKVHTQEDNLSNYQEDSAQRNLKETMDDEVKEKKKTSTIKDQLKSTNQIKTNIDQNKELGTKTSPTAINSFQELIRMAHYEKEVELKFDLERNVKLVSFSKGKIDIEFNEKLNKNFIKTLTDKLLVWTGERWIISLSKNTGSKTFYEKKLDEQSSKIFKAKNTDAAKKFLSAFPDAKLIDIKEEDV